MAVHQELHLQGVDCPPIERTAKTFQSDSEVILSYPSSHFSQSSGFGEWVAETPFLLSSVAIDVLFSGVMPDIRQSYLK